MNDTEARLRALAPDESFIVQAPAGSGKTELLIQRYLRLLATVNEPEQIIAITFTRKAAAEMRSRILAALDDAASPHGEVAAHRALTRSLASAALERDAKHNWNIRSDSQRMRIGTLDAFNATLAMHLPLLSGGAAGSEICDDAPALYREAARRSVEFVWQADTQPANGALVLAELDFDTQAAERLITDLLQVREQWIGWLFNTDEAIVESKNAIEKLRYLCYQRVISLLGNELHAELIGLTRHAHEHGAEATVAITAGIEHDSPAEQLQATANLFLTKEGAWRRRFTKAQGFSTDFADEKSRLLEALEAVSENADLAAALDALRRLPREGLDESAEQLLTGIAQLMRHAVAELRLLFAQRRVVDFSELSLSARFALGSVEAPSDLLLALDHRIAHILVDEFQDTSLAQTEMLEALTSGWVPGDGCSLFLVGDPMQSIYRFRNADMSLFIAARRYGVGAIPCTGLELTANFRSAPAIVEWVNESFAQCFPGQDDLMRGVAAFGASTALNDATETDGVQVYALDSTQLADEHAQVVKIIEAERQTHADSHIAILVRSRTHLAGFQELLKEHGWQARAVEIDAPYTSQLAQDLIGLARALTHFGDRLAWLALLRAPWCGLQWQELELLAGDDADRTIWEILHDEQLLSALSGDARERVTAVRSIIHCAIDRRAALSFVDWLEETWRSLEGHTALIDDYDESELDSLFAIFEQAALDEDVTDAAQLEAFFRKPLRQDDNNEPGIDIMTIHRAKGLEFDCVILPGLARTPRAEDKRLLEWLDVLDEAGTRSRILAPLRSGGSALIDWIRASSREQSRAEIARLLYVATTRAKSRLHLVWGLAKDKSPPESSLLRPIWPLLENSIQIQTNTEEGTGEVFKLPLRRRCEPLSEMPSADRDDEPLPEYEWTAGTAASVGIVVHEWLQTMCEQSREPWTVQRIDAASEHFAGRLELLGVAAEERKTAAENVRRALQGILKDPRGQWIIGAREDAESEVMLSSVEAGQVVHQRLDRTFVDQDIRWIVDYKTSVCRDGDTEAFLAAEVEKYRAQLERYARFMATRDQRPIRLGLYFPLLPAFREWSANVAQPPAE